MKLRRIFSIIAFLALIAVSCKGPAGERAVATDAIDATKVENYEVAQVNLAESQVEWIGTKPTGQHYGTVKLSDGVLHIAEDQVVGGKFVIDLNTLLVTDITDPEMNANLRGHLISADFFEVATWPVAEFEILRIEGKEGIAQPETGVVPTHTISGNLTIKGITKAISFDAQIERAGDVFSARTVQFIINRTEWAVNYGSNTIFDNLQDNFIHDDIALKINLTAQL